ncbi:aromatic-ring-hydroxylating dioxygenase subunit beta [Noviherbaspirillum malthae]|jgi:3-phenylpropionate/cinnamic acid dioxygenase small subunit|uniref:aromatic-ring-hydroxylating dioxygenase subunit beta n=1 Tax=Noviherbaspirillum malthae TaxID=1260987 RepID=UPI00188F94A1|nr:aromatic-ring-hydroxylating dioxygenase subunit beta [Noviherbaspirillum malthae]
MSTITQEKLSALNAAYARCIDNEQLEQWPEFFQEKCLYLITTADNHAVGMQAGMVYADTRGMLRDRIVAMREANVYEEQRYRHIIGISFIVENGDRQASVETPFIVMRIMRGGETIVFATGRYLDRVVTAEDGALMLAERIVVCDSTNIDTLLVLPL